MSIASLPPACAAGARQRCRRRPFAWQRDGMALALAVISVMLGFLPLAAFGLVQVGRLDVDAMSALLLAATPLTPLLLLAALAVPATARARAARCCGWHRCRALACAACRRRRSLHRLCARAADAGARPSFGAAARRRGAAVVRGIGLSARLYRAGGATPLRHLVAADHGGQPRRLRRRRPGRLLPRLRPRQPAGLGPGDPRPHGARLGGRAPPTSC